MGLAIAAIVGRVSPAGEVAVPADTTVARRLGLHKSRNVVLGLAALFSLDAFAGGPVQQGIPASWFHAAYGGPEARLGAILFAPNALPAASARAGAGGAARAGPPNSDG